MVFCRRASRACRATKPRCFFRGLAAVRCGGAQDWLEVERRVKAAVAERRSYELHYRIRHADGRIVWAHGRGQGIWDENGRLQYFDGLILDNTPIC